MGNSYDIFQLPEELRDPNDGDGAVFSYYNFDSLFFVLSMTIFERSTIPIALKWLDLPQVAILEYKSIICAGYSAVLHIHTCAEEVAIKVFLKSFC